VKKQNAMPILLVPLNGDKCENPICLAHIIPQLIIDYKHIEVVKKT